METSDPEAARALATAGELRAVLGRLTRRLREAAHLTQFTWPQIQVLGRLERDGPATASALARAEGVRPQSMGETVAGLKAAGLISAAPDPVDGRQSLLSLTFPARGLILASRVARQDWLFHAMRDKLDPAQQERLADAAALLKRLLD